MIAFLHVAPLAVPPAAVVAVAPAEDDIAAGERAWKEERWDDAAEAFARAYAQTGDPTFLYTRAQAERRAGRCEEAIAHYEEFLETDPADKAKELAHKYIDECRASLPEPEPDPPEPEPDPPGDPTAEDPATEEPDPPVIDDPPMLRPWYRDPWGDALVGVGVVAAAAGGAMVGVAYRRANAADDAPDDRAFGQELDGAQTLERAGAITLGAGAALLVAGVVRWAVVGAKNKRQARVLPYPGGAAIVVRLPSLGERQR